MYLSHPVRRIRDDPDEDATVRLRITAEDGAREAVADRIAEVGRVEERLRFGGLRVTIPQRRLPAVCELEGIAAIETADTLGFEADAGEDVRYDSTCR